MRLLIPSFGVITCSFMSALMFHYCAFAFDSLFLSICMRWLHTSLCDWKLCRKSDLEACFAILYDCKKQWQHSMIFNENCSSSSTQSRDSLSAYVAGSIFFFSLFWTINSSNNVVAVFCRRNSFLQFPKVYNKFPNRERESCCV